MDSIGQLRYRIRFAVPIRGRDENYGGDTITYVQSETLFAGREYGLVGSGEQESAGQKTAITRTIFTIRGRKGIDATMEVIHDSKRYRITALAPTERLDYLKIETEQIGDWNDQSLVQGDGQSLIDADGNTLIWQPGTTSEGYQPPGIRLIDADGNFYYRS